MPHDPINDFLQGRPVDMMDLRVAIQKLLDTHKANLRLLKGSIFLDKLSGNLQESATHVFQCGCGDTHTLQFEHTISRRTIRSVLQTICENLEKQPCLGENHVSERFHPK